MRLPDFIIIGAMKCATSTLHEQLARQPRVFMSTPKEPCWFSDDEVWTRGIDWYASHFAAAPPNALCGESSTHYTKLPTYPRTISRMIERLPPQTRFIYIIRHPIDRLVSHYIHEWTQRALSCPIDLAIDQHPALIDYSRYAMQLDPYLQAFGPQRVLLVFFDRLSSEPQRELERVCRFIGYDGPAAWDDQLKEQNVSSQRLRASPIRDAIINLPGLKTLRRTIVPQAVRNRVKGLWTMKRRPQLSESNLRRLGDVFDQDLARLGDWLGVDLSCDSFHRVARHVGPRWRTASKAALA